jgi:hypothetical protein
MAFLHGAGNSRVSGGWWRARALLSREEPLAPGAKGFGPSDALPPVAAPAIERGLTAPEA